MNASRTPLVTHRLIIGLFLAAAGALLVADRFGLIDAGPIWHYWPLVLIALGLSRLVQPGRKGVGVLLIFLGGFFLLRELELTDLDFTDLFPFLLLLVGLSLVVTSILRRGAPGGGPWGGPGRRGRWDGGAPDSSSTIDAFAMLGGNHVVSNSQDFRGGTATAIAGGCEIDLRQATIGGGAVGAGEAPGGTPGGSAGFGDASVLPAAGGEAVIDAFAFWGGIDILVPEGWSVVMRGTPLLGAFEDRTVQPPGGSHQRLVVKGLAIMGGVEVKNHRERG